MRKTHILAGAVAGACIGGFMGYQAEQSRRETPLAMAVIEIVCTRPVADSNFQSQMPAEARRLGRMLCPHKMIP